MADDLVFGLKLVVALGCGLVGGVFFAFSTFVMNALARLQPRDGIVAMQSINIAAINPLFMVALFGTGAVCLFVAVSDTVGETLFNTLKSLKYRNEWILNVEVM